MQPRPGSSTHLRERPSAVPPNSSWHGDNGSDLDSLSQSDSSASFTVRQLITGHQDARRTWCHTVRGQHDRCGTPPASPPTCGWCDVYHHLRATHVTEPTATTCLRRTPSPGRQSARFFMAACSTPTWSARRFGSSRNVLHNPREQAQHHTQGKDRKNTQIYSRRKNPSAYFRF